MCPNRREQERGGGVFLSRLERCSSLKYMVKNRAVQIPEEYVRVPVHQDHTGAWICCEIILPEGARFPDFVGSSCGVDLTAVVLIHLMKEEG